MSREKIVPFERPPDPPPSDTPPDGLLLNPKDPRKSARAWMVHDQREGKLWYADGVFYVWEQGAYRLITTAELKSLIAAFLDRAQKPIGQGFGPFAPTGTDVNEVYTALQHLNFSAASAPSWLSAHPWAITDCVLCQNGILHIPTRTIAPLTPQFFSLNPLDFAYTVDAPEPVGWLRFLDSLLPDDPEPIALLQEWMGLMLTPDTRYHKILLIQGPPRCGKGTIARVMQRLVGLRNVCSPKLGNFGRQFGQAVLIDKTVAIFTDAKISGRVDTGEIVENLLSISGEDTQTIPRKGLPDWIGTPRVRFTILTNKLPRMDDDSGALLSRFLPLVLTASRSSSPVFSCGRSPALTVSASAADSSMTPSSKTSATTSKR
jgi:putative DNA primase/helicase